MMITIEDLTKASACRPQVELFRETFGEGARLTRRNLEIAAKVGLDISFLASNDMDSEKGQALWIEDDPYFAAQKAANQLRTRWGTARKLARLLADEWGLQ